VTYKKMAESALGVNGEYPILRLLVEYLV